MINTIYPRVAAWNSARYDRELNIGLAVALLTEEFEEWVTAKDEVAELDALCDLIYVALGVAWKVDDELEMTHRAYEAAIPLVDLFETIGTPDIAVHIASAVVCCRRYSPLMGAMPVVLLSLAQMLSMGLTYDQCIEAMLIVCDANDSKSLSKTASSEKANKDKGADFVSPEPKLKELLACARS